MRNQKREGAAQCAAVFIKKCCQESIGQFKKSTIGFIIGWVTATIHPAIIPAKSAFVVSDTIFKY